MIKELGTEDFNEETKEGIVLVDFYADWCGPCKMLHPIIEEIAQENTDIKVMKINIDKREDLAQTHNVMSIPTLLLIKDGTIVEKNIGLVQKETINSWLRNNR